MTALSFFLQLAVCMVVMVVCDSATFMIQTAVQGPKLIDEFVSFTIDAWYSISWNGLSPLFTSTTANTLTKALSPAYFRYGGTNQDSTMYNVTNSEQKIGELVPTNVVYLNLKEISQLIYFAKNNGLQFIFGHMLQYRFDNNTWDPTNSVNLLNVIKSNNMASDFIAFELGNEPDVYSDSYGLQNHYQLISPQQNANDMITFKVIRDKYGLNNIQIWGCDITHGAIKNYLDPYLQTVQQSNSSGDIDKITFHHYYGDGNNWNVNDFISIEILDTFITILNESIAVRNKYFPNKPILLGETGGGYGSNTNPLSGAFIAGFMWLDKLGLSAIGGLQAVCRQKLYGGDDCLLNNEFEPNPDYWSSYIFKGLVGNRAIYVNNELMEGRSVRVYAFCTRIGSNKINSNISYNKGDITVLLLNTKHSSVSIDLELNAINGNKNSMSYDKYLLTGNPNSTQIALNGKVIQMSNSSSLPQLYPINVNYGTTFNLEGISYGFIVIKNANASACL